MAKLTQAKRDKMSPKEFAGPGTSFPINDDVHARMAISGATRSEHAGNISPREEASIKEQARHKLGLKRGGFIGGAGKKPTFGKPGLMK
jgi:hypothetical protein